MPLLLPGRLVCIQGTKLQQLPQLEVPREAQPVGFSRRQGTSRHLMRQDSPLSPLPMTHHRSNLTPGAPGLSELEDRRKLRNRQLQKLRERPVQVVPSVLTLT